MLNRIGLLAKLELCNLFGFNEARYSKDRKHAKGRGIFFAYIFLDIIFAVYMVIFSNILVAFGMAEYIPSIFTLATTILTIFTSIFLVGNTLFNNRSYERLAPLPFKPVEIVISRFIYMYVFALINSVSFLIPPLVVGGISLKLGVAHYIGMIGLSLLIPLLALSISILLGTLFMLLTANIKHKNAFKTILMIVMSVGIIGLSWFTNLSMNAGSAEEIENIETLRSMLTPIFEGIEKYFLPGRFFKETLVNGNIVSLLLYIVITLVPFLLISLFVAWRFVPLCQKLNMVRKTKSKEIKEYKSGSALGALVKKELKRLFSSSTYLTNSIIGYILAIIASISFAIGNVSSKLGDSGIIFILPTLLISAELFTLMLSSTTSASISMEGKNLWILKTIPVKEKTIYDAKIIANYIFALPAYIVSILVLLITSRFSNVLDYIVVILLPLVGLSFSVIIGLKTNLYNPNLNWNNEVEAVKRSKSVAFLMFKVMLVLALVSIPSVILSIVLETSLYSDIFLLVAMIVIGLITFFGYKKVANYKLNSIE